MGAVNLRWLASPSRPSVERHENFTTRLERNQSHKNIFGAARGLRGNNRRLETSRMSRVECLGGIKQAPGETSVQALRSTQHVEPAHGHPKRASSPTYPR